MKTISVSAKKGVKSKAVSLSKAAKYLANFVESDSGASEANLGFLKRASAAFNELHRFHKEINKVKSRRSRGGEEDGDVKSGIKVIVEDEKKSKNKEADGKKRKKLEDAEEGKVCDSEERKSKKKRKKNREVEE